MTARIFTSALLLLLFLIVSCESDLVTQQANTSSQDKSVRAVVDKDAARDAYIAYKKSDTAPKTYDKILADIALEIPGYGGHYEDKNGDINIYLLNQEESVGIKSVLRQHRYAGALEINDNFLNNLHIKPGQYNFLQLYNWKIVLRHNVLGMKGVTLLDINEMENNLTLGIEDISYKKDILKNIREIGIPEAAVNIVEQGRFTFDLQEQRDDLAGGLLIQYTIPAGTRGCTLGPPAQRNGIQGFIVNAHCSENQFSVDNQQYFQATTNDPHIATETVNPSSFTGGDCPPGEECAYADAAFAEWENQGTWNLAGIYGVEHVGSTDATFIEWTIAASSIWPRQGSRVNKMGQRTGWTYGNITDTCAEAPAENNVTMLCQYITDYYSDRGDSGAPVFVRRRTEGEVTLRGIHWGHNQQTGEGAFSHSNLIEDHLGGTVSFY